MDELLNALMRQPKEICCIAEPELEVVDECPCRSCGELVRAVALVCRGASCLDTAVNRREHALRQADLFLELCVVCVVNPH